MKVVFRISLYSLFVLSFLFIPVSLFAGEMEDGFMVKGDFRWRAELDGRDFNSDTGPGNFSVLRSRLGMGLKQGDVCGFLQFQLPTQLGWNSSALATQGGDFHQAYMKVNNFIRDGVSVKIGRMEMKYGDERIIGAVGWSNVGRVFEGIVIRNETETWWADLFYTNQVERYAGTLGAAEVPDDDFIGLWGEYKPLKLQAFFLSYSTANPNAYGTMQKDLAVNTIGVHYKNEYESKIGVTFDFANQMGKQKIFVPSTEIDIAAWMLLLDISYKVDNELMPKIGGGIDLTTGDDTSSAKIYEGYTNGYYTAHKFRGYMDYFVADQSTGLRDVFLYAKFEPRPDLKAVVKFHSFATNEKYPSAKDGSSTDALGSEIDIVVAHPLNDNLNALVGLGYFMPAADWQQIADPGSTTGTRDADSGVWGFVQLQTKFDMMK
ncbi:MAG: alginate export family protein [Candidatus Electryonea clarkiae]|nr:alginate export family protein [Candidatus Electryonea clarkiae]MDP8288413.1 alginate export family protein [Candidatus Electryonea clarkiae]